MNPLKKVTEQRIEAVCVGPHVGDGALAQLLDRCLPYRHYLAGIMVNLSQVAQAAARLAGTNLAVMAPVAYPLGHIPLVAKQVQVEEAMIRGATQVDVLLPMEHLLAEEAAPVRAEIAALLETAGVEVAVAFIANLPYLSRTQQQLAARLVHEHGAALKTDTGVNVETRAETIRRLREAFPALPIHAGSCPTAEAATRVVAAGAGRVASQDPLALFRGIDALLAFQAEEA